MYNHIYSIVEDFVKAVEAVEQEKSIQFFWNTGTENAGLKEGCQLPKLFH